MSAIVAFQQHCMFNDEVVKFVGLLLLAGAFIGFNANKNDTELSFKDKLALRKMELKERNMAYKEHKLEHEIRVYNDSLLETEEVAEESVAETEESVVESVAESITDETMSVSELELETVVSDLTEPEEEQEPEPAVVEEPVVKPSTRKHAELRAKAIANCERIVAENKHLIVNNNAILGKFENLRRQYIVKTPNAYIKELLSSNKLFGYRAYLDKKLICDLLTVFAVKNGDIADSVERRLMA